MKIRRVVSLTAFLSFVVLAFTGIMLFFCPQGRVAHWSGWTLLGLDKEQYGQLHTTFMLLFLTVAIWHIVLNWRPATNYLRNKSRQMKVFVPEFDFALVITLLFFVGTLANIAPFRFVLEAGGNIKSYWEEHEGSPPWGHAEESSLAKFSSRLMDWERPENRREVRISAADAMNDLERAGLVVESESQTLVEIARINDTTPQALMRIIRHPDGRKEVTAEQDQANDAPTDFVPPSRLRRGRMTSNQ